MAKAYIKTITEVADSGFKIRCKFCDIKDTCTRRVEKEKYENANIVTYCTLTPNRLRSKKKR